MDSFIDFSKEPRRHELFYASPAMDSPLIKELGSWLRDNQNAFVRLYHGTSAEYPIMENGLLPTTRKRRNSLQSRSGFVSASIYEDHARRFGEMACPGKPIEVYAVTLCVHSLVADRDQLGNARMYKPGLAELTSTLANSLVFGHGAQVKGKIEARHLQPMSLVRETKNEDDYQHRMEF